jgi:tripartite ATP-independent transporter DctP family solute receptor
MNRKTFALASGGVLGTLAIVKAPAPAAQYEFKCGTVLTVDHPVNVGLTQMWREIEKESGGRIKVSIFPNSQLGGEASMFEQVRQGALQFYLGPPGVISQIMPIADVSYLGFAYKDQDEGMRIFQGPLMDYLRSQYLTKGIVTQKCPWDAGMQQMGVGASWHPIRTPDDLKGFKVRVPPSPILVGMMRELGGNGVSMNVGETYTSLQTKLIDGAASQLATIESSKFYEVLKYISLTSYVWGLFYLISSSQYWNSLPADVQGIIERNNTKFGQSTHRTMVNLNGPFRDKLSRQGVAFNAVERPMFKERLKPYYQYWANAFGPTVWDLLTTSLGQKLA